MYSSRQPSRKKYYIIAAFLALIAFAIYSLTRTDMAMAQASPESSEQAPQVQVEPVGWESKQLWTEFSGQLSAIDFVEIRPQVGGEITKIFFKEGSEVTVGERLFQIDPRPFQASLKTAQASLQAAQSQAALAKIELSRAKKLSKENFVSTSVADARKRDYQVANASIKAAIAAIAQAKLNLDYAEINAPISGRISRAEITQGNLVAAGASAPLLTTIAAHKHYYAEFDIDEQTYIRTVRAQKGGNSQDTAHKMPVHMSLPIDESVIYKGTIDSFDNRLNPTTGTIRARAIFENTDGALMPGMFATIKLGQSSPSKVMLIDQKAISTDQSKKFVYVIDDENKVTYREVTLGQMVGDQRVVNSGLKAGEQVVVNSLQRIRPDMIVTPVIATAVSAENAEGQPTGVIIEEAVAKDSETQASEVKQ